VSKPRTRCTGCQAPIQFQPGAGSRLCPFCGYINLVREQRVAAPALELKTDEIFHLIQRGELDKALRQAEELLDPGVQSVRLAFYRACTLFEMGQVTEAVYTLIDLTGLDAPQHLRADTHARLAEALFAADRKEEALESVERCTKLVEGHPDAQYTHAKILLEFGRLGEAAKVLEETLPSLGKRWKITFPPRPSSLLMMLARIYIKDKRSSKVTIPLENLLLQDTAAPLPMIAEAIHLLGVNYMELRRDKEEGLTLIRQSALLDPENRLGLLDSLKKAVEWCGGDVQSEIRNCSAKRKEVMTEIKEVFLVVDGLMVDPGAMNSETKLSSLNVDADKRTDILQAAAHRLGLRQFDRGTLYPLETMEDFRRWVVAWRAREYIRRLKREELEEERITKLKAALEVRQTRATFHRQRERVEDKRRTGRRRALRISLYSLSGLLVTALVFFVVFGDRWLDQFTGRLIKIECLGEAEGPPCTLHVSTGKVGRNRYRDRTASDSFLTRLLSSWLDQRVQKDGLLLYPLGFPWGDVPADRFKPCFGKPISKTRFSFAPVCVLPPP
jgi:tetratricopeptide (TPR) repeat protein